MAAQLAELGTPARPPTSLMFSRGNLISSRTAGDKTALARPSTAVRAVGYAANKSASGQRFDQAFLERAKQQNLSSANATIDLSKEVNPQLQYKNLENKIIKLLESSIVLAEKALAPSKSSTATTSNEMKLQLAEALNKAKEAYSLDRTLHRFRDQQGENIFHNFELTYEVFFNLAEQYENNGMYIEALNTYNIMTKNKLFPLVNQLKLNMGNIYYKMGIYPKAIKMYRMALDSVPSNLKQLRLRITQNIGILFVRMGQYADAASSFEFIMSEKADICNGIHLILCYYAMGDVDKMKSTFRNLCEVHPMEEENDLENEGYFIKLQHEVSNDRHDNQIEQTSGGLATIGNEDETVGGNEPSSKGSNNNKYNYVFQALKCDEIALYIKQFRNNEKRLIVMIVDLISPIIEENYNDGYNWCIEVIKASNLSWLVNELELNKALIYLRQNDVNQAIETLHMYDSKNESSMTATALINLSFIYINLGKLEMGSHCINQLNEIGALQTHSMALVNAGAIDILKGNYQSAYENLNKAVQLQPENFEANYNLGLVALRQNNIDLAEEQFEYLKDRLLNPLSVQHSHISYQLAKLQEKRRINPTGNWNYSNTNSSTTLQSYLQVLGVLASEIDSKLFEKVGTIYEQIQDHQEANHNYNEAYRINPSDISIAGSIGTYYIKLQATEKAIFYFERAVLANPNDPNLMLRIASCFRNSYLPPKQYLGMYEKIHARFPDNIACVRALVQVTKSLRMTELYEKYSMDYARLQKIQAERLNEQRHQQQRLSSAVSRRGSAKIRGRYDELEMKDHMKSSTVMGATLSDSSFKSSNLEELHDDPLGDLPERPRTGMIGPLHGRDSEEEEINTDSLLPI